MRNETVDAREIEGKLEKLRERQSFFFFFGFSLGREREMEDSQIKGERERNTLPLESRNSI